MQKKLQNFFFSDVKKSKSHGSLKKEFKRDVDVKSLQRVLATYVLK